jgi:outer membrane receptor protein involved in Fe transport
VYYQYLYDVAVENDPTSPFVLNNEMSGYVNIDLVNKGTGRNYGLELTLERFYANRFYFLATTSLFESKFTALDGVERNSAFNGNYASNLLIGKEFPIGDRSKNRSIALNSRITFTGGAYYTPIDLEASIESGDTEYFMDQYLDVKADDVFRADLSASYRRDRKRTTHEFKIDVQNVTNHQAVVYEYYDESEQAIEKGYQWTIFPNVIYTIQF